MALVAPFPCTEAVGRSLLCDRWMSRYFFKSPVLLLDPKQPADIFSDDDNHEEFPAVMADWEFVSWDSNSIDGWTSEDLMFSAMPTTEKDPPGDRGDNFFQESADFIGLTTDAGNNQHGNGDFKESKTCSGASGLKPDDEITNMQQKQQHVDSFGTGVHLWSSEVAPTHSVVNEECLRACRRWETVITAAMKLMDISGSMNCSNNSGCMTISAMLQALNDDERSLEDTYQRPQRNHVAPVINFTEQKREAELHSIFGSIITDQDSISKDLRNTPAAAAATTWIVASAAPHHATGNRALLSNFTTEHGDIFLFGGDAGAMPMEVVGHGSVVTETIVLPDVWYVPGLVANMVSVSQLADLDYSVAFGRGKCYIRSTIDGAAIVGTAHAWEDGLFALDFLRVPLGL